MIIKNFSNSKLFPNLQVCIILSIISLNILFCPTFLCVIVASFFLSVFDFITHVYLAENMYLFRDRDREHKERQKLGSQSDYPGSLIGTNRPEDHAEEGKDTTSNSQNILEEQVQRFCLIFLLHCSILNNLI